MSKLFVLLAVVATHALPVLATQEAAVEARILEFQKQCAKAQVLVDNRRWKSARELLLATLEEHREERYVLRGWPEIEVNLEKCAFWSGYEKPKPRDVVGGQLLSYKESSGKIKIKYETDAGRRYPPDFEQNGDAWVYPAVFRGPYSIKLEGTGIKGEERVLLACVADGENYYGAMFERGHRTTLYRMDGGNARVLDEAMDSLDLGGRFETSVQSRKISFSVTGMKGVSAAKPKDLWGQAGFMGFFKVTEVQISGAIEPAWIAGLIDDHVQEAWTEFSKTYESKQDVPEWLTRMLESGSGASQPPPYPGPDHPRHAEHLKQAEELLAAGDTRSLRKYARALSEEDTTEVMRMWLLARVQSELNWFGKALKSCEQVCSLDESFFPAQQLRVVLLAERESSAEGLAACRELVQRFPKVPDAHALLAKLHLQDGRPRQARATLNAAVDSGVSPLDFAKLQNLLTRALRGPDWDRTYEWRSKHYVVRSDLDEKTCFEASKVLEASYLKWDLHLRSVSGRKQRFPVYLFSGEASYMAYAEDVLSGAPENTWGLYSSALKQLLIWNVPQREDMFKTIRHEGFHQYFDQIAGNGPVWFNEGLAEYYETTRMVRGHWEDGGLHDHHVDHLQDRNVDLVALDDFLSMRPQDFYADARLHYAQAWAFVHFLLHSDKESKAAFDTYLDALIEGAGVGEAHERAFGDVHFKTMQRDFAAYINSL